MYGWAVGLTLWRAAAMVTSLIYGRIVAARNMQVPTDSEGDNK